MAEDTSTPPAVDNTTAESVANSNTEQTPNTETAPPSTDTAPAPAPTEQAPAVDTHGFSQDELKELRTFIDNNGGIKKIKSFISNPQKHVQQAPQQAPQQATQQQPAQPQPAGQPAQQAPTKPAEGYITQNELGFGRYMSELANGQQYAPLKDYLTKEGGKEFFDDLKAFNIQPMDNAGNINVGGIKRFLDLKVQTVPATQSSVEPSVTPTANYVQVGEEITNFNQAMEVLAQSQQLKAQGQQPHPAYEKAKEFLESRKGQKK